MDTKIFILLFPIPQGLLSACAPLPLTRLDGIAEVHSFVPYFFFAFNASAAFFMAAASAFCLFLKARSSSVSSLAAFFGAFRGLALPASRPG
jgi:hypothetical protein